jgi:glycine cleavage system transcriptional repressor
MSQLIVTAVGPDRPGIVADLSKHVHDAGASLADSRMVNLRGHFALLALVDGSEAALTKLRAVLTEDAKALGLRIDVESTDRAVTTELGRVPYRLKTYSADQPGIVARVTEILRRHGANVEELSSRVESAPFAGTPLFLLDAVVTLPKGTALRKLRDDLGAMGDALGCDVDIDPA